MVSLDYAYRRLVNALGPERVARTEFERMVYSHDFASLPKPVLLQWKLYPDFVVLPQTTEEVSRLVTMSDETGLPITPRGGGTGLYGGSVPNRGGVLIDLHKMNKILAFDPVERTVTVEAGATWKDLEEYVLSKGFSLPVIPTDAPGSTVGGGINSGLTGFGSYHNGSLRDYVLDLEVVLADGRVLHTGPGKECGGAFAELKALFFGAEGTLGIITKAVLRLLPKPDETKAVAYRFVKPEEAARSLRSIVDSGTRPYHATFLDHEHFVFERAMRAETPDPGNIVLVNLQGPKDEVVEDEKVLDGLAASGAGTKLSGDVAADLWSRRSTMYGARRLSRGLIVSHNLVPVARLEDAVARGMELLKKMKLNGAVHAFLVDSATASLAPYALMDDTRASGGTALGFVKKMGDAALELGGHPMGLGLLMVFNLRKMHGRATGAMGAVKNVFDPGRKINGGKTIEVWTKFDWPLINTIPPGMMSAGLNLAAFLRRAKPTRDRLVRTHERGGGS